MITEVIQVIILSFCSILILFFLTKLMGNREMAQLSMFDYINSITIGSIAAEMATALEDYHKPITAMITYAVIITITAIISSKSLKFRQFVSGKSLILYENGQLYKENFKKAKLDLSEFLSQCRNSGYFNLSDLQSVVLEANGRLSFLPLSNKRPVNPNDMNLSIPSEKPVANVILDGKILENNLKSTGNNMVWLENEIKKQGITKINDIFLATCDIDNNLSIYVKVPKKTAHSIFE